MMTQRNFYNNIRITIDIALILIIYLIISYALSTLSFMTMNMSGLSFVLVIIISWTYISKRLKLYDEFRSKTIIDELLILFKVVSILAISLIVLSFSIREFDLSRSFVLLFCSAIFVILSFEKFFFKNILFHYRRKGRNLRSIIIIGAGEVGLNFYSIIKSNPQFGYYFHGFIDDDTNKNSTEKYIGSIEDLKAYLSNNSVDEVVIALPNYADDRIAHVIAICEQFPLHIKIIPDYYKFINGPNYRFSTFYTFPIISIRTEKINQLSWKILKRFFDLMFSLIIILLILTWLYPLLVLIIKLSSKGPVLFKQERWGRNNNKFYVFKFRSMNINCKATDINGKYQFAIKNDPRITSIGKFLRKTNLDELPQFWNVLLGEMSVVGPRPHPTPLNIEASTTVDYYLVRHLVKPGITGWAQINGLRGEANGNSAMQNRVNFDIWYIDNWSMLLDLKIIVLTLWRMIKGDPHAY